MGSRQLNNGFESEMGHFLENQSLSLAQVKVVGQRAEAEILADESMGKWYPRGL